MDPSYMVSRKLLFKNDKKKKNKTCEYWCSCTQVCDLSSFPFIIRFYIWICRCIDHGIKFYSFEESFFLCAQGVRRVCAGCAQGAQGLRRLCAGYAQANLNTLRRPAQGVRRVCTGSLCSACAHPAQALRTLCIPCALPAHSLCARCKLKLLPIHLHDFHWYNIMTTYFLLLFLPQVTVDVYPDLALKPLDVPEPPSIEVGGRTRSMSAIHTFFFGWHVISLTKKCMLRMLLQQSHCHLR